MASQRIFSDFQACIFNNRPIMWHYTVQYCTFLQQIRTPLLRLPAHLAQGWLWKSATTNIKFCFMNIRLGISGSLILVHGLDSTVHLWQSYVQYTAYHIIEILALCNVMYRLYSYCTRTVLVPQHIVVAYFLARPDRNQAFLVFSEKFLAGCGLPSLFFLPRVKSSQSELALSWTSWT